MTTDYHHKGKCILLQIIKNTSHIRINKAISHIKIQLRRGAYIVAFSIIVIAYGAERVERTGIVTDIGYLMQR